MKGDKEGWVDGAVVGCGVDGGANAPHCVHGMIALNAMRDASSLGFQGSQTAGPSLETPDEKEVS